MIRRGRRRLRGKSRQRTDAARHARLESLEARSLLSISLLGGLVGVESNVAIVQGAASTRPADLIAQSAHDEPGSEEAMDPNAPEFVLHHGDTIPNFAQNPDRISIASGSWFHPATWSGGVVPQAGEVVQIGGGTTVVYDAVSDVAIRAVGVNPGAHLKFATHVNTRLVVSELMVLAGAHLEIGSEAEPVASNVTAEIVIADQPLDLARDPRQFGAGVLGFGKVEIFGDAKSRTWVRLGAEAHAGDLRLELPETVTGWHAGDTLVLPDSRQVHSSLVEAFEKGTGGWSPQWEEVVIDHVEGTTVWLTAPLQYDHLGARSADGTLDRSPHAALLDRNVIVRSENPQGTRGHVLMTERAEVDIRYARFSDLGRTDAFRSLDNTTFDQEGNVTHIGTNQIGRYSLHMHHLIGPHNPTNEGYQFRLVGNAIDAGRKWGVTVHATSFGLVQDNVGYDIDGAAFVTENGTEIENEFLRNIAIRVEGVGTENNDAAQAGEYGRAGSGYFFRRSGNIIRDNVAANADFAGFSFFGQYVTDVTFPLFRGADPHDAAETYKRRYSPPGVFAANEAYGAMTHGLDIASPNANGRDGRIDPISFDDMVVWHAHKRSINSFNTDFVTLARPVVLGDVTTFENYDARRPTTGIAVDRGLNADLRVIDARIEGQTYGITTPRSGGGSDHGTVIEGGLLQNYVNLRIPSAARGSIGNAMDVRNVRFRALTFRSGTVGPLGDIERPYNIFMEYVGEGHHMDLGGNSNGNLVVSDVVTIYDYEQIPGNDFRVYYIQQRGDFVVPQTSAQFIAAPVPGLTNTQLWAQHSLAIAGAVAPSSGQLSHPEIFGLAFSLLPSSPSFSIAGPASGIRGQPRPFTFALEGQSDSYRFDVDWNGDTLVDESVVASEAVTVAHIFPEVGVYHVSVVASPIGGGESLVANHTIAIASAALQPDVARPERMNLVVGGTLQADEIDVRSGGPGEVLVTTGPANDRRVDTYQGVTGRVLVYGQAGSDVLTAEMLSSLRAELCGGEGDDRLTGGSAADLLLGGPGNDYIRGGAGNDRLDGGPGDDRLEGGTGNDVIQGGAGNDTLYGDAGADILVGGYGQDRLIGGDGDDLLIGGVLQASNEMAAIRAEWTSDRQYIDRVTNLRGMGTGPRSNGNVFLRSGERLIDDGAVDHLMGEAGADWHVAALNDIVTGLEIGEVLPTF